MCLDDGDYTSIYTPQYIYTDLRDFHPLTWGQLRSNCVSYMTLKIDTTLIVDLHVESNTISTSEKFMRFAEQLVDNNKTG